MDRYILDDDNMPVPVTMGQYFAWHKTINEDARTGIGRTEAKTTRGDVTVSTVFLGADHGWGESCQPVLWETMVFRDCDDVEMDRYTSYADAMRGHEYLCRKWLPKTEGVQ